MNPIYFVSLLCAVLFISCSFTKESCPVIHKRSQLTIREHIVMYEHVIGYCSVEEKIYETDINMVQKWIKDNPNKPVYHTIWGILPYDTLMGMYVIHLFISLFVIGCWAIILDEEQRIRRKQSH